VSQGAAVLGGLWIWGRTASDNSLEIYDVPWHRKSHWSKISG